MKPIEAVNDDCSYYLIKRKDGRWNATCGIDSNLIATADHPIEALHLCIRRLNTLENQVAETAKKLKSGAV